MIEDLYSRLSTPTATEPAPDPVKTVDDPSTSVAETAEAAQKRMREIAKAQGLEPDKLDFSNDEENFIKSIISQRKADEKVDDPNGGPVDTGNHSAGSGTKDYTKVKPSELINRARKNWKPVRGRPVA
jgi:hypothetical protein